MRTLACLFLGSVLFVAAGMAAGQKPQPAKQDQKQSQTMSPDMRRAIQFERAKARADARQARTEARHPTVFYNHDNSRNTDAGSANRVIDPGPPIKK